MIKSSFDIQNIKHGCGAQLFFDMSKIITTEQIKAARILLGWDQPALANAADLGIATVRRVEGVKGPIDPANKSALKIKQALEAAGVAFLPETASHGLGVRLGKG